MDASDIAERMRGALEASPLSINGEAIPVTASFGVASTVSKIDPERLLDIADQASYEAKSSGEKQSGVGGTGLNTVVTDNI